MSKLLGHSSVELTAKVYAHLAPNYLASQVAKLSFAPKAPEGTASLEEARGKKAMDTERETERKEADNAAV